MNKRHYEHTLPNIRGSLSNTYDEIKNLDVNNLTPLEALNKLSEIRRIITGK